jgi:iron-sulfur cluster repair protein YtfE (RIC family)
MDQREDNLRQDIEDTRASMTEKIEMIENRVHETMDGTKSTIDNVMDNVKRVQGTVEHTKVTIDNVLETIKESMNEAIERAKYTADLIDQVHKNPWIMFGCAILTGYALSSIEHKNSRSPHPNYEG